MKPDGASTTVSRTARLRPAIWLLMCLATGGSAAADPPTGVSNAAQPNVAQSEPAATDEAPIQRIGNSETGLGQFDLECAGIARRFAERPEQAEETWNFDFHYVMDLDANKYCSQWCETYGLSTFPRVDADTITLMDGGADDLTVETIDRRDGRYTVRTIAGGLFILFDGTCRQMPFSGLPYPGDSLFQGRDADLVSPDELRSLFGQKPE